MLTLWYIILGWKEYNKPFRKAEQPPKPEDLSKKPDLIPLKKDVISQPKDITKSDPPKSDSLDSKPNTPKPSEPYIFNSKTLETPKIPETKPNLSPSKTGTPKMPETPKPTPKAAEILKTPEAPNLPSRSPETSKMFDFRLAPEVPKKPETPKIPEPTKITPEVPKPSDSFKLGPGKPDSPKLPEVLPSKTPSRRPESVMPEFPVSTKNPAYVPPSSQSEFPIPPYLPGAPQSKPLSKDDELFAVGSTFKHSSPNRPMENLREMSYAKGELPNEEVSAKVQETLSKIPKYMEQSVISNPDSLESDEDEDF